MELRPSTAIDEIKSYSSKIWIEIIVTSLSQLLIFFLMVFFFRKDQLFEEKLIAFTFLLAILEALVIMIIGWLVKRKLINLVVVIVILSFLEISIGIKQFSSSTSKPAPNKETKK